MIKRAILLILFLTVPLTAGNFRRFQVDDIANPAKAEANEIAINLNFDDLWIGLQDIDVKNNPGVPQYRIKDLGNPDMADYNTVAMRINFEDLYNFKLSVSSPARNMTVFVDDILDPAKSEENSGILNGIFDDLWTDKISN